MLERLEKGDTLVVWRLDRLGRSIRDLLTLKRQDEEDFSDLREAVLERDGYRCRVCDTSGRNKR